MHIKCILFDIDGTITDTLPLCLAAFQKSLSEITGQSFSIDQITAHFGKSEAGIMTELVPRHMPYAYQRYCQVFQELHQEITHPISGLAEIFSSLHQHGIRTGFVTGRGPETTHFTLQHLKLMSYAEVIETGSPDRVSKILSLQAAAASLNLPPAQIIYVGDTLTDISSAQAIGMWSAAAAWTPGSTLQPPLPHSTVGIFTSVAEFQQWLSVHLFN